MRNGLRRLHRLMRRLIISFLLVLVLAILAVSAYAAEMKIIVAVKGKNLYATLEDNPASRALYELMPITVKMRNLYKREMKFDLPAKLPVSSLAGNNYRVGDIIYWPPRQSLAIIYSQNGERFRRQHLGHIDSGAEIFRTMGDTVVTFAPAE